MRRSAQSITQHTVTVQTQHTVTAHSHSTVTAQSQHSHSHHRSARILQHEFLSIGQRDVCGACPGATALVVASEDRWEKLMSKSLYAEVVVHRRCVEPVPVPKTQHANAHYTRVFALFPLCSPSVSLKCFYSCSGMAKSDQSKCHSGTICINWNPKERGPCMTHPRPMTAWARRPSGRFAIRLRLASISVKNGLLYRLSSQRHGPWTIHARMAGATS